MHIDIKLLLFIIDNNLAHDNKQLDSVPILCTRENKNILFCNNLNSIYII